MKQITKSLKRITCVALAALMLSTVASAPLQAQTNHLNYDDIDNFYYDPRSSSCPSGGVGPGTGQRLLDGYALPAEQGKTGNEEPINALGQVPSTGGRVAFAPFAALGQEYRDYYITMRWNYRAWNWDGTSVANDSEHLAWLREKPRRVLVTNPRTGKSIIAVIMEAGPAPWTGVDRNRGGAPKQGWSNPQVGTPAGYTGRVSGFPPKAIEALGAQQGMFDGSGDVLQYSWAPDQNATPGPAGAVGNISGPGATCSQGDIIGSDVVRGPPGSIPTVFYSQADPRWSSLTFHPACGNVASCGCGATSFAMVAATIKNDGSITPQKTVELWNQKGWALAGGTAWAAMHNAPKEYGFNMEILAERPGGRITADDLAKVANAVRSGKLVIMTGKGSSGLFTSGGHLVVVRGVTADGQFLVNDPKDRPDTKKATNRPWPASVFLAESYGAWAFYK